MGKFDAFVSFCTVMGTISIFGVLAYLSRRNQDKADSKKELLVKKEDATG